MAVEGERSGGAERHGLEPIQYIQIGVALTIITGVELFVSLGPDLGDALIPILVVLSAVKFIAVAAFFMHLWFEPKLFTRMFAGGVLLAGGILIALIALFWTDFTDAV